MQKNNHLDYIDKIDDWSFWNYKYQIGTNINIFFSNTKANIDIAAGQPMAHIIPLSESPIEIKTHVISDDEMRKKAIIYSSSSSFVSKYINRVFHSFDAGKIFRVSSHYSLVLKL